MKKIIYFGVFLSFIFSLTGCTRQQGSKTDMTLHDMAAVIMESQSELPKLQQITPEDEEFASYLSDYYLIRDGQVKDGIICYADGVEASEIAVLLLNDEKESEEVAAAQEDYIQKRAGVFEEYAPQQAALAKDGIVVVNGEYVALLICKDTSAAKKAFLDCFGGGEKNSSMEKSEPESESGNDKTEVSDKTGDSYDSDAVLQAWESGDDSSLSEMNLSILNAAKDVIDQEISDDMSDYEKELAIHDWITGWSSFDYSVFGRSSDDGFESGSDTPYGVLIEQEGMCHGYSSTFQLFMDMLGIECITVFGTPGGNGVQHSWNMVRLDGEWYCVDVAWDDPIGGSPGHRYFNVTSQTLRDSGIHKWDESSVPEADATAYSFSDQ